MDFLTIVLVLTSLFIGWNIGANDAANCMGTSVGAGILNYKKAAILVGVFALLGAYLQGGNTIKTVGSGVIEPVSLTTVSVTAALLGAALLVTYSTYRGIPVSTTQAVIGAIAAIGLVSQVAVNWGLIGKMFGYWVLSPLVAVVLSYSTYRLIYVVFRRYNLLLLQRYLYVLVLLSGIFLSYSLGANNVGNAMGLVASKKILAPVLAGFLGGFFIAFGSISFGKRVMKTVGSGITEIDSRMAFAAQVGGGVTVYLLTAISIPTSTSHAIIGGIAGVGLVKGVATINKKQINRILQGWFLTPLLSAVLAVIIFFILSSIV